MKLFEHQEEAIAAIEGEFAQGKKRTLAVLATGAGKTIIYLNLVDKWSRAGSRVLILAHRRELIHQPVDRAKQFFPALAKKMGIVMSNLNESSAQVVVATVQTVSRENDRLAECGFDYVILDEAHHGTAATYMKMVDRFPDAKWLGLTATPFRTDGDSLAKVFDSVAYRFPITAAIDRGVLVPFDAYGFSLPVSVDGVEETVDGWAEESLGELLSVQNVLEVVYDKWLEYCKDRRTICFTSSVNQAHATAEYFRSRGVLAEAVDGSTPKKIRDDILALFRESKLQVVCNCQVWTEGVDVPEASAALMVCPTKSDLAYVQKLGRILRVFPGKKDAVVLDFAPMEDRNIVMAGDVLGVPRVVEKAKEKAEKSGLLIGAARVDEYGIAASVDPAAVLVEALQYLRKGNLAWSFMNSLAVASLSTTLMVAVELPDVNRVGKAEAMRKANNWDASKEALYQSLLQNRLWVCRKGEKFWTAQFNGSFKSVDQAISAGEKLMSDPENYQAGLAKKRKKWRLQPVSDPQRNYMLRLGICPPEDCTCGQAAQLISHELALRTIVKARPVIEQAIMKGKAL